MAGYVIAQIEITDAETFGKYRDLVAPTIAKYGGRYLIRGGELTPLEETLSRTRFPWTQNWLNRSVQGGPEHDR